MSMVFHQFTLSAAAEVVTGFLSKHNDVDRQIFAWGLGENFASGSIADKILSVAKLCATENPSVRTANGDLPLDRAFVELALGAPPNAKTTLAWKKLIAGLRFDSFEVVEEHSEIEPDALWGHATTETTVRLVPMLPADIPEIDFREADNEVQLLLDRHGFVVARGHLQQAMSAFGRGEWASANGALRNFYESYLNQIAITLGYQGGDDSKAKRDFLGELRPPFLLSEYNEWNENNRKPQYVQGLMSRMHPHGGHPGLSEEEDAAFRLQISLITARLFLRRLDQRGA